MKHIFACLLLCSLLSSSVHGGMVTISTTFDGGDRAGDALFLEVLFDDLALTGSGFEELGPAGGGVVPEGLTGLTLEFDTFSFDLMEDVDFPDFPTVVFIDGVLSGLDFIVEGSDGMDPGSGILFSLGIGFDGILAVDEFDAVTDDFIGSSAATLFDPIDPFVPEPASATLWGVGLVGMALVRMRKR